MKQQTIKLLLLLIGLSFFSCEDEQEEIEPVNTQEALIKDARDHFYASTLNQSPLIALGSGKSSPRKNNTDRPVWEKAHIRKISLGDAVIIPLASSSNVFYEQENYYVKLDGSKYMMMYKDRAGNLKTEVVTRLPDSAYIMSKDAEKKFSGKIIVEGWNGEFIRGFYIKQDQIYQFNSVVSVQQETEVQNADTKVINGYSTSCTTTHYYYYTAYQAPVYNGSETICYYTYTPVGDTAPFAGDYGAGSGGGGSDGGSDYTIEYFEKSAEFLALEQEYRSRMTAAELEIYDNLPVFQQIQYLYNALEARRKAQSLFPNLSQQDDIADAYRHAYWNLLNTAKLGYELAERLGNAHEMLPPGDNPRLRWEMDLHNNKAGRDAWLMWGYTGMSVDNIMSHLVSSGSLVFIRDGQLVPSNQW